MYTEKQYGVSKHTIVVVSVGTASIPRKIVKIKEKPKLFG